VQCVSQHKRSALHLTIAAPTVAGLPNERQKGYRRSRNYVGHGYVIMRRHHAAAARLVESDTPGLQPRPVDVHEFIGERDEAHFLQSAYTIEDAHVFNSRKDAQRFHNDTQLDSAWVVASVRSLRAERNVTTVRRDSALQLHIFSTTAAALRHATGSPGIGLLRPAPPRPRPIGGRCAQPDPSALAMMIFARAERSSGARVPGAGQGPGSRAQRRVPSTSRYSRVWTISPFDR
jgi:hypothetical protein